MQMMEGMTLLAKPYLTLSAHEGSMRRMLLSVFLCTTALAGAPLAASRAVAQDAHAPARLTRVVFATGFIPNVLYTPYYVAQDRGYYRKAGLDVSMNYDRVPNLLQLVGTGKYTFGSATGDSIIPAQAQHIPVTYVMAQYQKYPIGAMALKSAGVPLRSPSDLRGRRVGFSGPNGPTYIGLRALLKAAELKESDVSEINIGFTETESLINHQIDVAMTFIDNEPVQAAALGHPVNVLPVSGYFSLIGPGVATSTYLVNSHPKLVQAFVSATLKGLRYMLAHPNQAFAMAMKRQPEITDPRQVAIQKKVLMARFSFQRPPRGHPLGWSDPKAWQKTVNLLRGIGVIPANSSPARILKRVYTDRFTMGM